MLHCLSRNLWVLEKGELVYYVGAVAVVYNRMDERQRHYRGHTEDISCMDLHPLGDTVVSGQGAGQGAEQGPQVHVWNVHSMDTLQVGGHGMSRCHLHLTHLRRCWAWAPCRGAWRGWASPPSTRAPTWWRWTAARTRCCMLCTGVILSYLLLLQVLHMWDWAGADLLSKVTLDTAAISGVAFHPFDNNLVITHGRGHLAFWNRWMSRYLLNIYTISTQYLYNIDVSQEEGRVLLPG